MPENDFEKQVQQLFDELRLKPSAEVWPKVSSRIRNEKGRKRALIWLPLALLLLGSGGYWLLQNNGSIPSSNHITKTTPAPGNDNEDIASNTKNNPSVSVNSGDISKTSKQKINIEAPSTANNADTRGNLNNNGSGSDSHASNGQQHSVKPPANIQASGTTKQQARPAVQFPVPDNAGESNKKDMTYAGKREPVNSIHKNLVLIPPAAVPQSVEINHLLLPGIKTEKVLNGISKDVSGNILNTGNENAKTPVKLTKKKVWEWGIAGGAGVASVNNGLSDIFGSGNANKSAINALPNAPNMQNNMGILTGQNSLVAAMPAPASVIKKGLAWQIGGFVKWKMTSKFAITGGLQYSYYSTNREVGSDINNYQLTLGNTANDANASYAGNYIGGQNINYTNRYHFIEIPAGVQWQLNKSVKLPLQLNGGLSLSYLVNTTALHYHTQTGSYYKDKALFNKMQAGIYAGLSTKLFEQTQQPLYIGPVVQYNLSNLLKPSANLNQHFIYAGLKAEWVLGKK